MSVHADLNNNDGFTLAEVMMAIVVLTVGMLGLMEAMNLMIGHNMKNQLRTSAVLLADERMATEMVKPFNNISAPNTRGDYAQVSVNNAFRNYSVIKTGTALGANSKNIQINVKWKYKGNTNSHMISTVISKTF